MNASYGAVSNADGVLLAKAADQTGATIHCSQWSNWARLARGGAMLAVFGAAAYFSLPPLGPQLMDSNAQDLAAAVSDTSETRPNSVFVDYDRDGKTDIDCYNTDYNGTTEVLSFQIASTSHALIYTAKVCVEEVE